MMVKISTFATITFILSITALFSLPIFHHESGGEGEIETTTTSISSLSDEEKPIAYSFDESSVLLPSPTINSNSINNELIEQNRQEEEQQQEDESLPSLRGGVAQVATENNISNNNKKQVVDCTCVHNSHLHKYCCRRRYIKVMKGGANALAELFNKYFIPYDNNIRNVGYTFNSLLPWPITSATCDDETTIGSKYNDYKDIVVTRHLYDGLVSGYLYHKGYHECYKKGTPYKDREPYIIGKMTSKTYSWSFEDLETKLGFNTNSYTMKEPGPSINKRNLCEYINDETEYNGMRLYIEFALFFYIRQLISYHNVEKNRGYTLFGCYDDLTGPDKYVNFVNNINNFIYPDNNIRRNINVKPLEEKYNGVHSAGGSNNERIRLFKIIHKIDIELYDGLLLQKSNEFGCNSQLLPQHHHDYEI